MPPFNTSPIRHRWLTGAAAAILFAAGSGCGTDVDVVRDPASSAGVRPTVITRDFGVPNDEISIDSAHVIGDELVAVVSHGGGCSEHTYQLVIGSAWMESSPVQVRARLAHNANGDPCRALLRRELNIDLRPLANAYNATYRQAHGSVSIQLTGTTAALLYTF